MIETIDDMIIIRDFISRNAEKLDVRERWVLIMRLGFGCHQYTQEAIGEILGVTKERIRQIEAKAIRKLRHWMYVEKIIDYKESEVKYRGYQVRGDVYFWS